MSHLFHSQVNITAFNVGFNVFLKTRLRVFLEDEPYNFMKTKVTSQKIVAIAADQLGSDNF